MKIQFNKDIVEFVAETQAESDQLDTLWEKISSGITGTRQLDPVGIYAPGQYNAAVFQVRRGGKTAPEAPTVYAKKDSTAYCAACNKTLKVKAGEPVPNCCGRPMKLLD